MDHKAAAKKVLDGAEETHAHSVSGKEKGARHEPIREIVLKRGHGAHHEGKKAKHHGYIATHRMHDGSEHHYPLKDLKELKDHLEEHEHMGEEPGEPDGDEGAGAAPNPAEMG